MAVAAASGRRLRRICAAWLGSAWLAAPAHSKEEPLLQFGLGAGAVAFEDYRGSDTTHGYPVPIAYLLYNGTFLKADRNGIRGTFFNQDWVEINVSGNATSPVRHDSARSGMPDLKATLEAGPSVDFHLLRSADARVKFDLRVPLRAAVTVQASPRFIGWTFTPRFAVDVVDPFGWIGWNAGIQAGPLFAARRYHDYFYAVAAEYETASRPAYQPGSGYAGTESTVALSKRFSRFWVGAYARADTLSGAVFAQSPLVRRDSYWSAGFGFAWMIHTSAETVEVPD